MPRWNAAETGSDRVALANEAGMGRISLLGVVAGTLVAYGAFVVLFAIASAIATAISDDIDLPNLNWAQLGIVSSLIVAVVLLLSYFFGGYVAGRMARRSGAVNGVLVFVLSLLVMVVLTLLVAVAVDNKDAIAANLRNAGIPTTWDEWGDAATIAGLASLVAMLLGAVLGGIAGERWHGKLARRAMDPSVGAQARHQQLAAERQQAAEEQSWRQPPPPDEPRRDREEEQAPAGQGDTAWGASRPWATRSSEGAPQRETGRETHPGPPADREAGTGPRVTRRPRPPRSR